MKSVKNIQSNEKIPVLIDNRPRFVGQFKGFRFRNSGGGDCVG